MLRNALVVFAIVSAPAVHLIKTPMLQIVPGASLTAHNIGEHVQAHGAGFTKVQNTYYMIGEDKTRGSSFQNINCYKSPNLIDWDFVGSLLSLQKDGDLGPGRVVERPKVMFNDQTSKYVLFMHIDSGNYAEAKVGVAVCDTVCGKYSYIGAVRPLGHESRDIGVYKDEDGSGYLLSEDRSAGLRIYKLAPDYLSAQTIVYTWREKIEAPAMMKLNGLYYMFGSHLSGWDPNDNVYSTASSIAGPWSEWRTFAPKGTGTFKSQTNYVMPVTDKFAIYMGDRWISKDLARSTYVWLPLDIDGPSVHMANHEYWDLAIGDRRWRESPTEQNILAKNALLKNGARLLENSAVGYIGGPSNGSVIFEAIPSSENHTASLKIYYRNGEPRTRYASLAVNNDLPAKLAFLYTENHINIAAYSIRLKDANNKLVIQGHGDGWGPDIVSLRLALN